jgi:hypothetical protein
MSAPRWPQTQVRSFHKESRRQHIASKEASAARLGGRTFTSSASRPCFLQMPQLPENALFVQPVDLFEVRQVYPDAAARNLPSPAAAEWQPRACCRFQDSSMRPGGRRRCADQPVPL